MDDDSEIQWKPLVSLATVVTIVTGALVYHIRLRTRERAESTLDTTVETY